MELLSILFMVITALISTVLPVVLIIYYRSRYGASFGYFAIGVLVFTVFQILLRLPLIQWLSNFSWFYINIVHNQLLYVLFLSLTAGIFEEIGRFLAFKFLLVNNRSWENGMAFGIGHGGVEAVTMVGINYVFFVIIALNMNYGWFSQLYSIIPNAGYISSIMTETPSYLFLMAGIERLLVMVVHMALSLLVLTSVRTGKYSRVVYAVLLHALLNSTIIFASKSIIIAELILLLASAVSLYYIEMKKKFWKFII